MDYHPPETRVVPDSAPGRLTAGTPHAERRQARRLLVGTSFAVDDGFYPNFKSSRRLDKYWKNIAAMMATARRFTPPGTELVVFTTDRPAASAAAVLERLGVRLESPVFSYRPPEGFYSAFQGAFYLFDALTWCSAHADGFDDFLFLDPDCLIAGPLDALRDAIRAHDFIVYQLAWPLSRQNNGVTREDLQQVFAELSGRPCPEPPSTWGGEMLAFSRAGLDRFVSALPEIWAANLARFHAGKPKLNTEEHVTAYFIWRDRPPMQNALGHYVKRFWTGYKYRNCFEGDERLPIWHLPGEKSRGMLRVFALLAAHPDLLDRMSDTEIRARLAKAVGLRGAWVRDFVFNVLKATGKSFAGVP